jgi:hypothetical protein
LVVGGRIAGVTPSKAKRERTSNVFSMGSLTVLPGVVAEISMKPPLEPFSVDFVSPCGREISTKLPRAGLGGGTTAVGGTSVVGISTKLPGGGFVDVVALAGAAPTNGRSTKPPGRDLTEAGGARGTSVKPPRRFVRSYFLGGLQMFLVVALVL